VRVAATLFQATGGERLSVSLSVNLPDKAAAHDRVNPWLPKAA
jgi:hypothetical protein